MNLLSTHRNDLDRGRRRERAATPGRKERFPSDRSLACGPSFSHTAVIDRLDPDRRCATTITMAARLAARRATGAGARLVARVIEKWS